MEKHNFVSLATKVIDIEIEAIQGLKEYLNDDFDAACQLMMQCQGKVVVTGMGKSGHIAKKIAATLASTGTSAFYVHPGEASHGDLGMMTSDDVILAISNSGETDEVISLIPVLKRQGSKIIGMSGNTQSTLARNSDRHVCVKVKREACPLGLAPTASTTATLAMGDAMAVAILEAKGFTEDDFALSHPGGSLGKRLLLKLEDIMHSGDELPIIKGNRTISESLVVVSEKGLGMTAVVNDDNTLAGLFTDGDLRRVLDAKVDIHNTAIKEVMTRSPLTAKADMLAAEALNLMETRKINGLIIVNELNHPIGAMNMHDLLRAGVY